MINPQINLISLHPHTCRQLLAIACVIERTGNPSYLLLYKHLLDGMESPGEYKLGQLIERVRIEQRMDELNDFIYAHDDLLQYLNENPDIEEFDLLFDLYYYLDYYLTKDIV